MDLGARRARRVSLSWPQLAAAAVALMLVGAGSAVWMADAPDQVGVNDEAPSGPAAITATATPVSSEYDVAVAELEALLEQNRDQLDSVTVRIVEENLRIIDRAIAEAEAALAADPSDVYLNTHLANTMRQKVAVLRRAMALVEG